MRTVVVGAGPTGLFTAIALARRGREVIVVDRDPGPRAIRRLSEWIDPRRSQPISPALPGGRLYNIYRGQLDAAGRPVLPGLISVGDAVCTTTPLAGRGVTLALMQARELVRLLDPTCDDILTATTQFDSWCAHHIRPWFDDHRYTDADRVRRWSGGDVDLSRRLPSDLIVAAAEADPQLKDLVGPYSVMDALPAGSGPCPGDLRRGVAPAGSGRPDSRRAQRGGVQDTGSRLMP